MFAALRTSRRLSLAGLIIAFSLSLGAGGSGTARAATPILPIAGLEQDVISQTSALMPCVKEATRTITTRNPVYTATCTTKSGSNVSVRLERFGTASQAATMFQKRVPSSARVVFFHEYTAKAWQTSTKEATTRIHIWYTEQWLVTSTSTDPPTVRFKTADPALVSEVLRKAALEHYLFN